MTGRLVRRLIVRAATWAMLVATAAAQTLDSSTVRATVESVAAIVGREYVFVDVADRADAALRRALDEGRYANEPTEESLARSLSRDLYAVSHDKHLTVNVVAARPDGGQSQGDEAARARDVRRTNAGVRRVEILPGNVGYLDIANFFRPEEARDALATAMHLLNRADALILDMRRNGGGSPGTIALLASYLIADDNVPLFEISHRAAEPTVYYRTEPVAAADRNATRPVYVLTSASTFSGGEGVASLLQERRSAEVVGETTAGAANPGRPYVVNERFTVTVPNGQLKLTLTGRNWEGTGVTPDVRTPAASALSVAYGRALRRLIDAQEAGAWRDTLERILQSVEAAPGR